MSQPKYTPIQSTVINSNLDTNLFHTYARLIVLAWKHDFKMTDWLRQAELVQLIGLDWSTIKRHTAALKCAGLINWTTDRKNGRQFSILEVRLGKGAKAPLCAPSSSGSSNININDIDLPLLPAKAQDCALDAEAWDALRAAHVGEPARTDLSNLPHVTARYVRAMSTQAQRDGVEIGALIYRIRNDWPAPNWCDQCSSLDGEHADTCPTQVARRAQHARPDPDRAPVVPVSVPIMSAEMQQSTQIWQRALDNLQLQLTSATYDTWLRRSRLVSAADGVYVVGVHNGYAKDWLENRLYSMIKRTLVSIINWPVEVRFVVLDEEQHESVISNP